MIDLNRAHAMELYNQLGLDLSDDEFETLYAEFLNTALRPEMFARVIQCGVDLQRHRIARYAKQQP